MRELARNLLQHNLNTAYVVPALMYAAEDGYLSRGVAEFSGIDAECQMWFDAGMRTVVIPYVPRKPVFNRQVYFNQLREHFESKGWLEKVIFFVADEPHDLTKWYTQQARPLLDAGLDATTEFHSLQDMARAKYLIGKIRTWWMSYHCNTGLDLIQPRRAVGERTLLHTMETSGDTTLAASAAQFRGPLWMAVKWDVEGFSFWALRTIGGSNWHWMPKDSSGLGHFTHCDPERHRILKTVRYERLRQALDEVKMLYLLKDKIQTARHAGRDVSAPSAALQRAMQMVTDVAPRPTKETPAGNSAAV